LVLAAYALINARRWSPALIVLGLAVALTGLAIGVQAHGWVTLLDGPTASWIAHRSQHHHRLGAAARAVAHVGNPATIAMAAVVSGMLLSTRDRSLVPGIVVVATTGAAVLAKDIMAAIVERPVSTAEIAASPGLGGASHTFPSGHVAGTAALLGIVAIGIAARGSGALRALLASCVVAGTLIVAASRLILEAHWLSDVVGGALLAGIVVTVGAAVLAGTSRTRRRPAPARRGAPQRARLAT
jgi:undecaprenyl-diphosphatase